MKTRAFSLGLFSLFFLLGSHRPSLPESDRDGMARLLQVVARQVRATPDPEDVKNQAARLGFQRAALHAFVRDRVKYLPYRGSLRGAGGTLATRGGNSLDQALLLRDLLLAAGEEVRLVHREIEEEVAEKLVGAYLDADPVESIPVNSRTLAQQQQRDEAVAALVGAAPKMCKKWLAAGRREEQLFIARILESAQGEAKRLQKILNSAGKYPSGIPAAGKKELLADARDHFWAQVREGETWQDLDPVIGDPLDRSGAKVITRLDDRNWHLEFSLVLNRLQGKKPEQVGIIKVPLTLKQAAMRGIFLALTPGKGELPPGKKLWSLPLAERLAALAKVKVMRTELHVDGRVYGGVPFDRNGQTFKTNSDGRIGAATGIGKSVGNLMGGMMGGGKSDKPSTEFVDLQFRIKMRGPGGREESYSRTLLAAPAKDQNLVSLPVVRWAFLIQTYPLPGGERQRRFLAAIDRNATLLGAISRGDLKGLRLAGPRRVAGNLLRFADYRTKIMAHLSGAKGGRARFLWDRPGIVGESWQLFLDRKSGRGKLHHGIDLVDNDLSADTVATAMTLGVADTALEAFLLAPTTRADRSLSSWALLSRSRLQGHKARIKTGPTGRLQVSWSPAGKARAWWSIAAKTGMAVGRVPSGGGQAMLEAAIETRDRISQICDVSNLAKLFIASDPPKSNAGKAGMKMWDAACGLAAGNMPAAVLQWKMDELTGGLWEGATNALAGL